MDGYQEATYFSTLDLVFADSSSSSSSSSSSTTKSVAGWKGERRSGAAGYRSTRWTTVALCTSSVSYPRSLAYLDRGRFSCISQVVLPHLHGDDVSFVSLVTVEGGLFVGLSGGSITGILPQFEIWRIPSTTLRSKTSHWFLVPADRFNTALVCHRWRFLVCHPRLWLRVDKSVTTKPETGVFPNLESAIAAARPGDTILISSGGSHLACNVQIRKPLCLIGGGDDPDDTVLICSRGFDSALEFLSTCKLSNLTVKAELGCCLLHRSGKLTIDGCVLQCEEHPLDHLSCAIVSTANAMPLASDLLSSVKPAEGGDSVSVLRTRIQGGAKAVLTSGSLALQQVRVMYARTALFFWFNVSQRLPVPVESRK